MPNDYQLMRMSEEEDEDALDADDLAQEEAWEEEYLAFYDDCKLKNSTKQDW